MNGRERIALAMQHKKPDRVPVMCQLSLGHYFLNTDIPPEIIWFTSQGFAEALVKLQRRYRFDGILVNIPGRPDHFLANVVSTEDNVDGRILTWKNGDTTFFPWDDNPQHTVADKSKQTVADFMTIDPDNLDIIDVLVGYVWGTYHIPYLQGKTKRGQLSEIPHYFYKTISLVKEMVGNEVSVHGEIFSPLTHYMELFGYENALVTFLKDSAKTHAILERLTEASIVWGVAQARHGVDAVLISSAFVGGPFLSPKMYKEFVVPYEKLVTDAIKSNDVPVYTHTCGSIGDRMDLIVETGTQGIDTLDPPPLGNTELVDAKAKIGNQVFIKGNMNSVDLLAAKTEEEVINHATDRILTGKPGGGYILSTACSVSPRMEPWKLELLVPLAEEIGRYE
jgi:uroporphyrinogen-III decarboxylase|tara:strand:+ start:188 stop:1369 length:1182 start_codon:yes stop_codon:yes gene_type:complete